MTVASSAGEAVGAVLSGKYKLVRLIGEGGLAAVYEAHEVAGAGRWAVKLLHAQYCGNRAVMDRFYAEARACYSLHHPHIVSVDAYDYAEDGTPYLVMELLEGQSLEDLLADGQPLLPEQATSLALGVLDALGVAHQQGIVHRDLKPANLFVVHDGAGGNFVKVLDFGIAKVMDLAGGMGSKTRTGAVLGTPGYMSPEQVKNAKAVDARSDLWAVGVVLYEMLTCRHPFGAANNLARMVAVLRDQPAPIAEHQPALSGWQPFFDRALARDPAARFQSAAEMSAALGAQAPAPATAAAGVTGTVALPQMAAPVERPMARQQQATAALPAMGVAAAATPTARSVAAPGAVAGVGAASMPSPGAHGRVPPLMEAVAAATAAVVQAPVAGAYPGATTQISEARPFGTPTVMSDVQPVQIIEAADAEPPALVWWGAMLLAVSCFMLGLLVGYLLGAG